jgi:hypothetical protein
MRTSRTIARALGVWAAVGMLAACMGGGSQIAPSRSTQRLAAWIAPDAKKGTLLYISDASDSLVFIYSYPQDKVKGTLSGFDRPEGLCSDKAGDVWIVNTNAHDIVEYAHGGTTPIATLSDANYYPLGCSVDPTTGNLAVSNLYTVDAESGSVSIYRGAKGTSENFANPTFFYYFYCGYDDRGNLFVDGQTASASFAFAELPRGGSKLKSVLLNQTIAYPGGVQWDGKYVAVGDRDENVIYQFAVIGRGGTEIGSTPLDGADQVSQFFIQGKNVIGPEAGLNDVGIWKYPTGGVATKMIGGFEAPNGAAISESPP